MSVSDLEQKRAALSAGAGWFYWIGGLSVVNTILTTFNAEFSFIFGLGITQVIDALALELSGSFKYIAAFINMGIAGIFFYLGKKANELLKWAFVLGLFIFGVDTLIFVLGEDYLGVAFHVFAFAMIVFRGLLNVDKVKALEKEQVEAAEVLESNLQEEHKDY